MHTRDTLIVHPSGAIVSALLWDDFRAFRARPVSTALPCAGSFIGHSRVVSLAPVGVR